MNTSSSTQDKQSQKQYYGWKSGLLKYTINLTESAREGKLEPVTAREKEINHVIDILSRRTKNNPLLIGESGVGKTAIIEGLAQKIISNEVPKDLYNKEVFQLDFTSLIAGASQKGEFQQRLKEVVIDIIGTSNAILFIDDIHLLISIETEQGTTAADLLKQYLGRGQLPLIGTTLRTEYRKYFDKNKSFSKDFQEVQVEEPNEDTTFEMISVLKSKYEKFHSVIIPDNTIKSAIILSKRYIPQRFLPDKALDLIDEASSDVKIQIENGKRKNNQVKKADIEKIISTLVGIPNIKLNEDEREKMISLEKIIHKKFIDQEPAVNKVSEAVRRGRTGLSSNIRPIASFIFLGTGGTGKTELAKVLTEVLWGQADALIQLDMSEYMEKQEVAKLIGAPPGYVGYEEGGILTEAVKKKPYSIILMDNIEKAHTDISNILLQVLEEGRLTDNKGNSITFNNTIIICTTNIGNSILYENVNTLKQNTKDNQAEITKLFMSLQPAIKEQLINNFAPELINRFDEIIIFQPLSVEHMLEISRLHIARTASLLKDQGFNLQITDKALETLAKDGYDINTGARKVRRLIQLTIENPIAMAIVAKKFNEGDTILIDFNQDEGFSISTRTMELLKRTSIRLPKIGDIARYDSTGTDKESGNLNEIKKTYELLEKIHTPENIVDISEKEKYQTLREELLKEKEKGNPTAIVMLTAAEKITKKENKNIFPTINGIQIVTDEEYEEVKKVWEENYQNSRPIGESQVEWIREDKKKTEDIIKLLISNKEEEQQQSLQEVSNILPFLLIGGFTKDEIIEYLKAKMEAAQTIIEALTEEEEETTIFVNKQEEKEKPAYTSLPL